MVDRFERMALSPEAIVLAGAALYLLIRFVLARALAKYTVHRGMFHSIPAAIIAGQVAFLLASGEDVHLRIYKAGAVFLGYMSHLVLDEVYSIEWYRGRLRLKKSFGTALKLISRNWWPNISTFAKLAILSYIVLKEPGWMQEHFRQHVSPGVYQTVTGETGPADEEEPEDAGRIDTSSYFPTLGLPVRR